jgi:hypothetical protein
MSNMRFICIITLLILLALTGISCNQSNTGSQEGGQKVAIEFIKQEATYRFDGIPETLKVTYSLN